jgi:heme/copper-type cytochrome/quinol oxidase subunit 3
MTPTVTAEKKTGEPSGVPVIQAAPGEGPPPPESRAPVISNARLGIMALIAAEIMFFSGLVGAFLVFRLSAADWPPPFQPRLPVVTTGVNTVFLLLSGVFVWLAVAAGDRGDRRGAICDLVATAVLGLVFLAVQGYEWFRLIRFGLTMSSGVYGATFYIIVGCHAAHVLAAVVWLAVVLARARVSPLSARGLTRVRLLAAYWTFVVVLWPALYALVYLY